jgi:putative tryptophan/tyrosine transport system substrate-binding protein
VLNNCNRIIAEQLLGESGVFGPAMHAAGGREQFRQLSACFVAQRDKAFQQGLEKLGWTVGRNLQIDYRWGISDSERATVATAELLKLAPDVILAYSVSAVRAAQEATRTIPIVFTSVSEPIALGFVASLDHPGGNTTGFTNFEPSVGGKWLELLKEIAPPSTRVAVMFNPVSTAITHQFVRIRHPMVDPAANRFFAEQVPAIVWRAR